MLGLKDFDNIELLASNSIIKIYAARYGKIWRFYVSNSTDCTDSGTIGESHLTLTGLLDEAYDYITKRSGYYCNDMMLTGKVIKKLPVYITNDQIVALNMAVHLLSNSNSDHADQTVCHIKKLVDSLK